MRLNDLVALIPVLFIVEMASTQDSGEGTLQDNAMVFSATNLQILATIELRVDWCKSVCLG